MKRKPALLLLLLSISPFLGLFAQSLRHKTVLYAQSQGYDSIDYTAWGMTKIGNWGKTIMTLEPGEYQVIGFAHNPNVTDIDVDAFIDDKPVAGEAADGRTTVMVEFTYSGGDEKAVYFEIRSY